ncbi:TonB-dependent receptor, plug [Oceanimonas sp. GK1]|uniref:TonB-dependent receptor domain-containing protein n=1 Tax=Oceanimonas sp. (strain GK1 / IBRC-M 10197) TaxID=511062 RepID=UPI0002494C8C|nr:TonB-dependent receptor [Oceanimonas sp. GK1]AEX99860.1 TonB-dependent receptor, plug [Oceanimonas sp. GK1]
MSEPFNASASFTRTALSKALGLALLGAGSAAVADEFTALDTVVVTAAGFEQNIAEAPASISVISREELQKKAYTDITDAVKNIPGVYVTGGGKAQDISIRGMAPAYTLYLVDGKPVSAGRSVNTNGSDGGKQIALPPISMIERVEVIRGPMSSLYGSEAMGGVINIITRKTEGAWSGTISSDYTKSFNEVSNDARQVNLFAGGALIPGLLAAQINGSWQGADESDFAGGDDGAASTPDSTRTKGGVKLILTPDEANEIGLAWDTAALDETATPGKSIGFTDGRGNPTEASTYTYHKDVYQLSHDGRYGDLMLSSYLQHDVSEQVQDLTKREEVTIFNTQGSYFWRDHVLTLGGQYKFEDFTDETNGLLASGVPGAVAQVDRWIAALFAEAEWSLTDRLNLTTGLRYDDDELFGGHLSPRAYVTYLLTPEWTLKGGVSTGYKQPGLAEATEGFGRRTGRGTALIIGNPDLQPEKSTSYEAGFVYQSQELGLNSSLMVFRTEFKDKIAEDRVCQNGDMGDQSSWTCQFNGNDYWFLSERKNIAEAEMQGAELSLDYDLTRDLHLSSSYTYTESEQKSGEFAGEPLNKIPEHMANASLDWQSSDRLNLWAQANYRGETSDFLSRTSMSDGTPGYTFFDAGLVYALTPGTDLTAGIYNIADKEVTNETYGAVLDGRRVNLGIRIDF